MGNSRINGYKQLNLYFNSNSDPFLLNIAEQVPIDINYYTRIIKQCQYVIMQEVIYDALNQGNKLNRSNINENKENKKKKLEPINQNSSNNSKIISNNNVGNNIYKIIKKEKENISCKKENIKINYNEKYCNKEINKSKKNEKIEIEAQLIDKNNYENLYDTKNLNEDISEE